ncbi:MAG: helix-turn-helix domain-containing protein [Verrucomicrobia bacterium]|nr:MAG: helix-turn-helix domain-containing protein [Verrucomicrobiota bacterium]
MDILDHPIDVLRDRGMAFPSPIDLSPQTRRTRYCLVRRGDTARWMIGYEECLPQYAIRRPDGFPFWTLEFIITGQGSVTIADRDTASLHTGTCFTYGPDLPVSFSADGRPMRKYFLTALIPEVWRHSWLSELTFGSIFSVHGEIAGIAMLEAVLSRRPSARRDGEALAESMLQGFAAWLAASTREKGHIHPPHLLDRAFELLDEHFREIPNVAALVDHLGVTQSHLCRVFKKHHHKSPYAELTDRKLQYAYLRLSQAHISVQQAALEVGYEDPFHFSRLFKRRIGFPPSTVR